MGRAYKPLNGLFRVSATEVVLGGLMLPIVVVESRFSLIVVLQIIAGALGIAYRSTGKHKTVAALLHLLVVAYWCVSLSGFRLLLQRHELVMTVFALFSVVGLPCSLTGLWFVVRTPRSDVEEPMPAE